jgi:tRNA-specific 2-thiouridylase
VLRERGGWQETAGGVQDADGRLVGDHAGAVGYTVGQRTGLGVALGERQYVARVDVAANLVQLGRREDLQRRSFRVDSASFVDGEPPDGDFRADVRIRHRAEPIPARIVRDPTGDRQWRVDLDRPAWAPAPGQAAVFYSGEAVVGGGRIAAD